jgi:hypothetical protein
MSRLMFFVPFFNESISVCDGYSRIYTDGSKEDAAAVVLIQRLSDHSSIFSAEARVILLALDANEQSTYDDSWSCPISCRATSYTKSEVANMSI